MRKPRRFGLYRRRAGPRRFLYALVPILLAILYLSGSAGFVNQYRLLLKKHQLEEKVRTLEARKAALEQEIDRLRRDPAYQERVARELFGLCRPDEVVFMMKLEEEGFERDKK